MTLLDIIVVALFIGLTILGYLRGAIREFFSLLNIVITILLVSAFYAPFSFIFKIFVENIFVAKFFALIFLFIIVFIFLMVTFLLLLSNFPEYDINEIADGVIGSILGIIQFFIITSYLIGLIASIDTNFIRENIKKSKTGLFFLKTNRVFFLTFKEIYKNFNNDFIKHTQVIYNLKNKK